MYDRFRYNVKCSTIKSTVVCTYGISEAGCIPISRIAYSLMIIQHYYILNFMTSNVKIWIIYNVAFTLESKMIRYSNLEFIKRILSYSDTVVINHVHY